MLFKYAIVLTGGISTGKSTVAKLLSNDFVIIDADKIAHRMLDLHKDKIGHLFGEEYILNNKVNRKVLGKLIFSNLKEKLRLEALLHPLIFEEIKIRAMEEDKLERPYLIDIPLFFESSGRYPISKSIVVYTSKELQLERLMLRDNSLQEEALERIDSQMSIEKKKQLSTYLIDNSKDLNYLQEECVKVKNNILINFFKD